MHSGPDSLDQRNPENIVGKAWRDGRHRNQPLSHHTQKGGEQHAWGDGSSLLGAPCGCNPRTNERELLLLFRTK